MSDLLPVNVAEGSLIADPDTFMLAALNRAKGWLEEARRIDDVRDTKAIALGYEALIREKELSYDAQLAASEIVRWCERRIGQLVRVGQARGEIRKVGDDCRTDLVERVPLRSPAEAAGVKDRSQLSPYYAFADATDDEFEKAIAEAREEGNLSRSNVVRKVKGESSVPERSEWHHKRRHIDANRILRELALGLESAAIGLDLVNPAELDRAESLEHFASIKRSIHEIATHLRRWQRA